MTSNTEFAGAKQAVCLSDWGGTASSVKARKPPRSRLTHKDETTKRRWRSYRAARKRTGKTAKTETALLQNSPDTLWHQTESNDDIPSYGSRGADIAAHGVSEPDEVIAAIHCESKTCYKAYREALCKAYRRAQWRAADAARAYPKSLARDQKLRAKAKSKAAIAANRPKQIALAHREAARWNTKRFQRKRSSGGSEEDGSRDGDAIEASRALYRNRLDTHSICQGTLPALRKASKEEGAGGGSGDSGGSNGCEVTSAANAVIEAANLIYRISGAVSSATGKISLAYWLRLHEPSWPYGRHEINMALWRQGKTEPTWPGRPLPELETSYIRYFDRCSPTTVFAEVTDEATRRLRKALRKYPRLARLDIVIEAKSALKQIRRQCENESRPLCLGTVGGDTSWSRHS